jgi:hypothetical protein
MAGQTYQLQYRKCGRPNCNACKTSQGHGPYWYAYRRDENDKLRGRYIGRTLPQGAQVSPRQWELWEQILAQEPDRARMHNGRVVYGRSE